MKVGKIIALASFLQGNEKLADKITSAYKGEEPLNSEDAEEVKKLISCYNITVSELSEEYLPLIYQEDLNSNDNKFYYSNFTKTPIEIKSVYKKSTDCLTGKETSLDFKVYPTYFEANDNTVSVEYEYLPKYASDINEESEYLNSVISDRVLAEGVVAEYCIIKGMFEQALMWRDRFVKSVQSCILKRKVKKIKPRGWF